MEKSFRQYTKYALQFDGEETEDGAIICRAGITQCLTLEFTDESDGCKHTMAIGTCHSDGTYYEKDRDCTTEGLNWQTKGPEGSKCSLCEGDMCNTKGAAPGGVAPAPAAGNGAAPAPAPAPGDGSAPPPQTTASAQASGVGVLAALAAVSAM